MNLLEFEDLIELDFPKIEIDLLNLNWIQYNPRKKINRLGCSITSKDGTDCGVPDLDSLLEFNVLNNTQYKEHDFHTPTVHSIPFSFFLNEFEVGRSHYLKLHDGGFFPWHRDNGQNFRVIYTIDGCTQDDLIWLLDDKLLSLQNQKWYYVNTKKKHLVFSQKESIFAVFNIKTTPNNVSKLIKHFKIK